MTKLLSLNNKLKINTQNVRLSQILLFKQYNRIRGYGIIQAIQIAGHRTVLKVSDLYNLSIPILSNSKGSIPLDAKFQLWSVCGETDAIKWTLSINGFQQ